MRWPWQHPDPAHLAELEVENELLDEYIESDGALPYPDLSIDNVAEREAQELAATNERAQAFADKQVALALYVGTEHVDHAFEVAMQPLSPPKKRELFKPPVLDDQYFEEKRAVVDSRSQFYSASSYPYSIGSTYRGGSTSYYNGGTWVGRYTSCEHDGHVVPFGSDRCVNCGRRPWE